MPVASTDFLVGADGRLVSGVFLATYVVAQRPSLGQVQIRQDRAGAVLYRVRPGVGFDAAADLAYLQAATRKHLGDRAEADAELVDALPAEPSGKFLFSRSTVTPSFRQSEPEDRDAVRRVMRRGRGLRLVPFSGKPSIIKALLIRRCDNRKAVMNRSPLPIDPELPVSPLRALCGLPFLVYRGLRWRALRGGWLPGYLRTHRRSTVGQYRGIQPIDVMVMVADHFEPARRNGDAAAVESVRRWCASYEEMAARHRDSDGRPPQHTWFYRYDYPNPGCVQTLSESTFRGFGEIEFHLHHGHDTHETMAATLHRALNGSTASAPC